MEEEPQKKITTNNTTTTTTTCNSNSRLRRKSSQTRKPLSEITNLNLIPTSTLRKLCPTTNSKPPNPIPYPIPKPKPNSKPAGPSAQKACAATVSPNSNTSIGSSSSHVIPPNHTTSLPGHADVDKLEPLTVYSRRQTAEKTAKRENADSVPFSLSPLGKTKDKSKEMAVPFSLPSLGKTDKGKAIAVPVSCSPVENTSVKGKEIAVPLENTKDKSKVADKTLKSNPIGIANDKSKGKMVSGAFSCPPLPRRTRYIRNELTKAGYRDHSKLFTDPQFKQKKKRRCTHLEQNDVSKYALPQDFIDEQRAYFKEIDEFELLEEEVMYDKFKKDEEA